MKFVPKFQLSSNPLGIGLEFWNRAVYWNKIPTLFQRNSNAGIGKSLMNQGLTRFIPKFQFFSRTTDFGASSRSFIIACECKHCAKQTIHCTIFKQNNICPRPSIYAGILELWNHVVLTHKTIILLYKYIYISTTTTNTFPIPQPCFCDSNPIPKFQHHFTNNQITPTSTT